MPLSLGKIEFSTSLLSIRDTFPFFSESPACFYRLEASYFTQHSLKVFSSKWIFLSINHISLLHIEFLFFILKSSLYDSWLFVGLWITKSLVDISILLQYVHVFPVKSCNLFCYNHWNLVVPVCDQNCNLQHFRLELHIVWIVWRIRNLFRMFFLDKRMVAA